MAESFVRVKQETRGLGTCRGCGAPIVWFETVGQRRMPFNTGYQINAVAEVVDNPDGGRSVVVTIASAYTHWATCPTASRFRTRGQHA